MTLKDENALDILILPLSFLFGMQDADRLYFWTINYISAPRSVTIKFIKQVLFETVSRPIYTRPLTRRQLLGGITEVAQWLD